jgi:predicted nucleic acid-binding protein
MNKIFIDANIYLNFFDSNKPKLKELLTPLLGIKDNVFISSQIVNEVNRNKLKNAERAFSSNNLLNNLSKIKTINNLHLPEQLEMEQLIPQNWDIESKKICKKNQMLYDDIEKIIHNTLERIMCSTDRVSQSLNLLFEGALEPSEHEIKAARYRREVGNPPGKPDDPLGDQISWEQFLNCSKNSKNILIVTSDQDYYTVFQKKVYLDSFLYTELRKANTNSDISISCFNTLGEAFTYFNRLEKINELPSQEELTIITKQELSYVKGPIDAPNFFPIFQDGQLKSMYLPPGFPSPNVYLQYLRTYDSEELQ